MNKTFLETIRLEDGIFHFLSYHQLRVESVFKAHNCNNTKIYLEKIFHNIPKSGLYRCRLIYTLDGLFDYEYIAYTKRKIKTFRMIFNDKISYPFKYANRKEIENLYKLKNGCDEIIIVKEGYITDTSIANIAFFNGDEWITPKNPLLSGTTRQRFIDANLLKEQYIKAKDIGTYKKIALMNAMIDFDIMAQENIKEIIC